MEKNRRLKPKLYLVFLFSIYIYPFSLREYITAGYLILCVLPIAYLLLNIKMLILLFRFWDRRRFACLIMILISVLCSILVPMLHNTNDYTYFRTIIVPFMARKIIPYVFLCVCLIKKYRNDACAELFMYYYVLATVCYVSVTCLFLLSPSLKNFWMGMVTMSDRTTDLLVNVHGYVARIGWGGFSGFGMTMKCSISIAFLMHIRFSRNSKFRVRTSTFLVTFVFTVLGNAFYGRTGLLASAIIVIFSLVAYRRISIHSIIRWIIGFAIIFVGFYILSLSNYRMHEWFTWMSSPFINFLRTGSFNTRSVNTMLGRMLFMPDFSTLLFGDGLFRTPFGYYMHTDLGFLRQILFWGLPITLMSYFLTYESIRTLGRRFWVLIWASVICVAIFEFKGLSYFEFVTLFFAVGFLEKERVQF